MTVGLVKMEDEREFARDLYPTVLLAISLNYLNFKFMIGVFFNAT